MDGRLGRRSMLALAAAGALATALPACSSSPDSEEEPYQLTSYGYDPEIPEPGIPEAPRVIGKIPPAASVRTEWLPPVGRQTMPNCYVWATVYGLATFYAARKSNTPPTTRGPSGRTRLRLHQVSTRKQHCPGHLSGWPNHQVPQLASRQWRHAVAGRGTEPR